MVSRYGISAGLQSAAAGWVRSRLAVPNDILQEYGWILGENRPAELCPPRKGPLSINWIIPNVAKGSGGLLNIFRAIYHLERWGHQNRLYTLGKWAAGGEGIQEFVRKLYFPVSASIEVFDGRIADSDALVATNWMTAYAVRNLGNTAQKFYFVQDLEYCFHAEGSLAEFARETYRWGFKGITLGNWIANVLHQEFAMSCSPFGFSYDREIYNRNGVSRTSPGNERVVFYARPNTERRGFELGILALSIVAKKRPLTEFVLVGFPARGMHFPFRAVLPGIVSPRELAQLYHESDVALVLSHTNLSMLPLELMACGCPVVSNTGPNVEWLLSEDLIQLARPAPQSLANAILRLLEDRELHRRMVTAGLTFAQQTSWELEIKKIEDAFYRGLGIATNGTEHVAAGSIPNAVSSTVA